MSCLEIRTSMLCREVAEIDPKRMRAVTQTEENPRPAIFREIFWTPDTNENLGKWVEKRSRFQVIKDPEALFICASGHHAGQRMKIHAVAQLLRNYSRMAQLPYKNAYRFWYHMGHSIIHEGGSSADAINILGHASPASSTV